MYSHPSFYGYFDPTSPPNYQPVFYSPTNDSFTNMAQRRPQLSIANLPEVILLRVLSHCDEEMQLESALVCKSWLRLSRRIYFSSYTIQSSADYRLLLLFLQPGYTVRAEYVTRLDVSFTSDESTLGATSGYSSRRVATHVAASDVHQLMNQLVGLESLRADWIGARGSSTLKVATSSPVHVPSLSIPSFLTLPHILQRLKHLEIRGGSWPLDSLLQSLAYMPRLINLSLENIYEPTASGMFLPAMTPAFHLIRLSLGRCTLSGESVNWLLSTSQHSIRHLTVNSLRRRPGSGSFNSALAIVGPSLESLRVRNYLEVSRWDPESVVQAGLGYCSNLKTLVVWCDSPQTSPFGGSPNISPYSPSLNSNLPLRSDSRPPSRNHPYTPSSPHRASLSGSPSIRNHRLPSPSQSYIQAPRPTRGQLQSSPQDYPLEFAQGFQGPSSPPAMTSPVPSQYTQPPPGAMLSILTTLIQRGWFPHLNHMVIPSSQIDACPNRVECQSELLIRGIALGDNWGSM